MDLKEFGRILKEERIRQGLELSEVMDKTKISRLSLEAIEEGNERGLPHPVYAKGFVKNYAKFLGLDADKMSNTLAQIYEFPDDSGYDELILADARKLPSVKVGMPRLVLLTTIVLLLVAIGLGVWAFQDRLVDFFSGLTQQRTTTQTLDADQGPTEDRQWGSGSGQEADQPLGEQGYLEETLPSLPEARPEQAPEGSFDEPLGDPSGTPGDTDVQEDQEVASPELASVDPPVPGDADSGQSEPEPDLNANQVATGQTQSDQGESAQDQSAREDAILPPDVDARGQAAPQTGPQAERTLEVRASANCWLSAQADDARPREAFLRPDERFVVSFEQSLELKLGNAGGVSLYLDGSPWPLDARSGEVLVLRFP
jgi:cytoskeleton protein RodZ